MFDEQPIQHARVLSEQAIAATTQAFEALMVAMNTQKELMAQMRCAEAAQYDSLIADRMSQYQAALQNMERLMRESHEVLAQQQAARG